MTLCSVELSIDLVLIDPQSVGKRTHDLMDTVNAKKRCVPALVKNKHHFEYK
jgi:hypothetical protein